MFIPIIISTYIFTIWWNFFRQSASSWLQHVWRSVLITNYIVYASVCGSCCHGQRRPFFKAQFHFKTQKQRFSDDLKVKSVVVIANFCDDHLFVCVCAIIELKKKYLKIYSTVCLWKKPNLIYYLNKMVCRKMKTFCFWWISGVVNNEFASNFGPPSQFGRFSSGYDAGKKWYSTIFSIFIFWYVAQYTGALPRRNGEIG